MLSWCPYPVQKEIVVPSLLFGQPFHCFVLNTVVLCRLFLFSVPSNAGKWQLDYPEIRRPNLTTMPQNNSTHTVSFISSTLYSNKIFCHVIQLDASAVGRPPSAPLLHVISKLIYRTLSIVYIMLSCQH